MSEAALSSPEFAGFWESWREGRLSFPECASCGRFHWYPLPRCPHCLSADWSWQRVSASGTLYSLTEVRHAFDKERAADLPYTVGLVRFDEAPGVQLIVNIVDAAYDDLHIGQELEPVFPPEGSEERVLFRPAGSAMGGDP